MSEKAPRKALGRGLSALLPGAEGGSRSRRAISTAPVERSYFQCPIEDVRPHPGQPRKLFDPQALEELARSITEHGIIQPLAVRPDKSGGYTLIAGERRWRAAQKAGLHSVPVVVQKVGDRDAFERALIENIQREDLNPIEAAHAYQHLASEFDLTQEQIAERVGKDRSSIANSLRLLKLPKSVTDRVESGELSMGHARALLALDAPARMEVLARKVAAEGLSVRATEKLTRSSKEPALAKTSRVVSKKSASVRDLEERLTRALGTPVEVEDRGSRGGNIRIRYGNLDQLDQLLEKLLS